MMPLSPTSGRDYSKLPFSSEYYESKDQEIGPARPESEAISSPTTLNEQEIVAPPTTDQLVLEDGEPLSLSNTPAFRLFFTQVIHYKSTNTEDSLPSFFNSWFGILQDVHGLTQTGELSFQYQQKLFFYLAHCYHYNAPFNQEENERLDYQTSPLAIAARNSYLRSSQTVWMSLASELVFQTLNTNEKSISIVWVDHPNFLSFLGQFYQVEGISLKDESNTEKIVSDWLSSYKEPPKYLYLFLEDLPTNQKDKLEKANQFADEILEAVTNKLRGMEDNPNLNEYFSDTPLPEKLREAAVQILQKGGAGKKIKQYNTKESQSFLEKRYGRQLEIESQKRLTQIQVAIASRKWDKDLVKSLFGIYCKNRKSFQGFQFKKPEDLEEFLKKDSESFIENMVKLLSSSDYLQFEDSFKAFQNDIRENLQGSKREAKDFVGIFYLEEFEGLKALLSPHGGKSIEHLVSILGNLGYSPDASRFLRKLIRGYLSFFPHLSQPSFLEAAMQAKWKSLPKDLQKTTAIAIEGLKRLKRGHPSSLKDVTVAFSSKLREFKDIRNTHIWFGLYQDFISGLLAPVDSNKNTNPSTLFPIKQMTAGIQSALMHQNDVHLFIRDMQDILEAWMLYIDIHPLVDDPAQVFQKALPSKPTSVHFTPYAMRSFTRVLQALNIQGRKDPLSIQVFNQSYFELITNMERFQEAADVIISRSDEDIDDCDVYFIDIHPNNAVEARLFAHNLSKVITKIESFPKDRFRTFVVDITLNALSSREVEDLLESAKPLIESGGLNLVLVQSLTKFSQLGLDKLSGGFLAAYNVDQECWKEFNYQLNVLQQEEPVDTLTLQFFACLAKYSPDFQRKYIEYINQNTTDLYKMVLHRYQTLNLKLQKDFLALTCNTDLHTCYLAFNSKGVLSLLGSHCDLSVEEISTFTKDIITELFIPLAAWLNLPLTERMSIGFPLSSINECMHAIRLTVGLEVELLPQYADIITYICFVLNRESKPDFFFEIEKKGSKKTYPKRKGYFEEKVRIFKSMYPIRGKTAEPVCIEEPVECMRNARREFILNNGTIQVISYTQQSRYGGPLQRWTQTLNEGQLLVHVGIGSDIPLNDNRMLSFTKCLLASCLTQRQRQSSNGPRNEHSINITLGNVNSRGLNAIESLTFNAFFHIRADNTTWNRFGDYSVMYKSNHYTLSFDFKDQSLWLVLNSHWYDDSTIFIKKGYETVPISWLDTDEKWNFFVEGSYEPMREQPFTGYRYHPDPDDNQTLITLTAHKGKPIVIIKRDQLIFNCGGVSLYQRKRAKDTMQLEIDFWGIKDPVHTRFLSLLFWNRSLEGIFYTPQSDNKIILDQKDCNLDKLKEVLRAILNHKKALLFQFDRTHST